MKRRLVLLGLVAPVLAGCGSGPTPRADIVFVSSRDGAYQLYGMNMDGKHQRRLTHAKGDPSTPQGLFYQVDPAWSPNGRLIAFSSKRDGPSHIFVMRADGTGTRRLTDTKLDDGHPSWSPSGKLIVFQRGTPAALWVMAADGSHSHRLGRAPAEESQPAWAPRGGWIAYVMKTYGTDLKEIWLVRPDGSGRHQLTRLYASTLAPAWSPDGRRIAFSSDKRAGTWEIYVVGADGKHLRELTVTGAGSFEPSWSADGKTLAFWSDGSIYSLGLGGTETQLTRGTNDSSPIWRPTAGGRS